MKRPLLALLLLLLAGTPVLAQSGGDPPPAAALTVSCVGFNCTLDASASADNGPLTYAFDCNRFPIQPGCYDPAGAPVFAPQSSVTVNYPSGTTPRTVKVTVKDTSGQTSNMSVTFVPGAIPTPTSSPAATATATATLTSTPSPTATQAAVATATTTSTPTQTPLPTATPPILFTECPGVYAVHVIEQNVMTMTCVKATNVPWLWETPTP